MDFHGLARRQLQALCKLNKIPANLTNVAMADALSALPNVEGIEEVMQPQSPGREESGSPEVPKTGARTSTRPRKPPVKVLESGSVVARSRARTSRKLVDDDDEVEDEKKDVAKSTPVVASGRKGAPATAAASVRKAEVPSVQRVYSTRRSVRLVEKQLSELCLGESKTRTNPIKIDNELSSEMTESDVIGDNLASVSNEIIMSGVKDDEVNSKEVSAPVVEAIDTAGMVQGNEVSVNVASVSEKVGDAIPKAFAKEVDVEVVEEAVLKKSQIEIDGASDRANEEVAMEVAGDYEKDISIDDGFDSVAVVEEASFKASADQEKVEKNAYKHGSDLPAAFENGNTEVLSAMVDEIDEVSILSVEQMDRVKSTEDTKEVLDSSEPKLVTFEKKLDALNPVVKEQQPEPVIGDKENILKVDKCFKTPKKPLQEMTMGELKKLLKGMSLTNKDDKDNEVNANKHQHQDTPRPTRQALEILPSNAQV